MPNIHRGIPAYRKHKASGQAVVTLGGRDHYLGPHGTRTSRAEYDRVVAEWLGSGRRPVDAVSMEMTLAEAVVRYWAYVQKRHVKNGKPTDEQANIRAALRPLLHLYPRHVTNKIGPQALRVVQDAMVQAGLARSTINERIARIRRMFRWLVAEGLAPIDVYQSLCTVDGLRRGQTTAKEPSPVAPVDDEIVEATLPCLPETVADMVRVQRLTGCRPSEICAMRPMDIDRSGEVWTYRPQWHKTDYLGRARTIFIGPKAQAILLRYLARDPAMNCFRPIDSEAKRLAARSESRTTPLSCGNRRASNRVKRPRRSAGETYDVDAFRRAIHRACDKLYPLLDSLRRQPRETYTAYRARLTVGQRAEVDRHHQTHRWSPNQLRHSAATEIRRRFDLEAARVTLGHAKVSTTEIYAQRDTSLAAQVAREIG